MTNKDMNGVYLTTRNDLHDVIKSFEYLLEYEKNALERYEETELVDGRNSKGEYVNFEAMRNNIKNLEKVIEKTKEALYSFSMSASVYK